MPIKMFLFTVGFATKGVLYIQLTPAYFQLACDSCIEFVLTVSIKEEVAGRTNSNDKIILNLTYAAVKSKQIFSYSEMENIYITTFYGN